MMTASYSVSFDVKNVKLAILDRDQSVESRALTEYFTACDILRWKNILVPRLKLILC